MRTCAGDVDLCLVPEVAIELEGVNGCLPFLMQRIAEQGHAVVVVAEGIQCHSIHLHSSFIFFFRFFFLSFFLLYFLLINCILPYPILIKTCPIYFNFSSRYVLYSTSLVLFKSAVMFSYECERLSSNTMSTLSS